ncbi:YeeE/YedE thiosulfate transporter family protein [Saccharicrinis sp. FJH62]|uniref:YeeE/YedE thiosulfate transporter family protein n=1 Tax=Saccharicrinis sp. FJH62 TaxID=3344657 RepID=UPI0035D47247
MFLLILTFGILFGTILQYAKLNRFNTISGLATLSDLTVAKALAVAVGIGAILLNVEIGLGLATFHVKPFIAVGIMAGGLIFGAGMAILGYCPGTMAVSLGEGSVDAFTGIIGGLAGGFVFTALFPHIQAILGPDWGKLSLDSLIHNRILFYIFTLMLGIMLILLAFRMHKMDKKSDYKWLVSGIALAVLNLIVFLTATTNRPIGASTSYPYVADVLTSTTSGTYFSKIATPGHWELIFLAGAFIAGLVFSLIRKEFKLTLIHDNWQKYHGSNKMKRIIWSFTGGFILIFGARMAGGCTSGHILSGGMQLAISSLVFAGFVFVGLLITGKLFYRNSK